MYKLFIYNDDKEYKVIVEIGGTLFFRIYQGSITRHTSPEIIANESRFLSRWTLETTYDNFSEVIADHPEIIDL